jgi:hypothetical protein
MSDEANLYVFARNYTSLQTVNETLTRFEMFALKNFMEKYMLAVLLPLSLTGN